MAQAHEANDLGEIVYSASDHHDGDNSTDDNIDNNNSTTSFRYEKFNLHTALDFPTAALLAVPEP